MSPPCHHETPGKKGKLCQAGGNSMRALTWTCAKDTNIKMVLLHGLDAKAQSTELMW